MQNPCKVPVGPKFKLNPRGCFLSFFGHRQTVQENLLKVGPVHVENAILDEHRGVIFRNNGVGKLAFTPNDMRTFTENLGKKRLYRYVPDPAHPIKIGVEKFTAAQFLIFRILDDSMFG